ncbi:YitT family protein [[Mycoplasma] anseris]|uniref:YitT family protein n=1 Tax=[Mycoplasma] anseris TaxID=92400 RepID=A0A2Z4NEH7_9BACT|nr:YitT family protein [[Mycoplasma] anseris]
MKKSRCCALKRKQKQLAYQERLKVINPFKVDLINIWKKYPKKVLWMFISAFLYNIAITVFLKKAATIASGTSSLSQIITFTAPSTEQFYGLFYVLVNLPLMFGFWRFNPRMFMVLTYYWMLFQVIVQCIFINYNNNNPVINFINQKISIYNPTGLANDYWDPFGIYINNHDLMQFKITENGKEVIKYFALDKTDINNIHVISQNNPFEANDSIKAFWDQLISSEKSMVLNKMKELSGKKGLPINDGQTWPILVYAILGGISEGFASVVAWKQRGSIGGTSVISNYIAYRNKKPVGNVFLFVALCFSTFSTIVIGSLEYTGNIASHIWNANQFLVRVCGTFVYLIVFTILVNKFYPKYKKVKIEIYSDKIEWIVEHLKKIGYLHSYNIIYGYSGFKHREVGRIETIALYLEKDWIFEQIKVVDKKAWIATSNIHDISGEFDTSLID